MNNNNTHLQRLERNMEAFIHWHQSFYDIVKELSECQTFAGNFEIGITPSCLKILFINKGYPVTSIISDFEDGGYYQFSGIRGTIHSTNVIKVLKTLCEIPTDEEMELIHLKTDLETQLNYLLDIDVPQLSDYYSFFKNLQKLIK